MSLSPAPRCRAVLRGAAVGAVVVASGLLGAPAVSAAEDVRPVIALDPPDVGLFLVPEEGGFLSLSEEVAAAGEEGALAAAALAEAAAAVPPESGQELGARSGAAAEAPAEAPEEAPEEGRVDVPYEGTVHLQLPALVDGAAATFVLDVEPPDDGDLPRRYRPDPTPTDQPLTVADLGGGAFAITVPAKVDPYGPAATLTVDGLTEAGTGADLLFPLYYDLHLTESPAASVGLQPTVGVFSHATCPLEAVYTESCPGATVGAGEPVDLVVPPDSLLTTLGFAQLDSAFLSLESMDDQEPYLSYDSETDAGLMAAHGPASATVHVPADARTGPYYGLVAQFDPSIGFAMTSFELDVTGRQVNPGLHSDTGWVDEVREVSSGSTAVVAGSALLLVGGLLTVAAVSPGRRPPLGG